MRSSYSENGRKPTSLPTVVTRNLYMCVEYHSANAVLFRAAILREPVMTSRRSMYMQ